MLRILLPLLFAGLLHPSHVASETPVPPALQEWQEWVLHDQPDFTCPYAYNQQARHCEWSSGLVLQLHNKGGTFHYEVEVFSDSWITLPGSSAYWPQHVRHNNQNLTVVERDGRPQTKLKQGAYRIEGAFSWTELPRTLDVPPRAGLTQLSVNQQTVSQPLYENAGTLWLQNERNAASPDQQNALDIKVFRKVVDRNPAFVETRIQLNVSGEEREIATGPAVLDGFTVQRFESDLPARVERDGTLRVQLKPGRWKLKVWAHSHQPLQELQYSAHGEHWPSQEIWVFESSPTLRTVQVSGLPSIDPRQTTLPGEWHHLPAYLAASGQSLVIEEQYRGNLSSRANQLTLNKTLWLAFSGDHFTVLDRISGEFNESRLETTPQYRLSRAEQNATPLVITQLPNEKDTGIEIRDTELNLQATSLVDSAGPYPASGWQQTITSMEHTLILPPGWSLLHATGADSVYGSWIGKWNLWHIFLLLLVVVALSRSFSWKLGALALVTLLLTYHRAAAPLLIWLNFAALYALRPYVSGKFSQWFERYTIASFIACMLVLTPFVAQQVRLALYPQLELGRIHSAPSHEQAALSRQRAVKSSNRDLLQSEADSGVEEVVVRGIQAPKSQYLSTAEPERMPANLYDANQKVQVGPGLPDWSWQQNRLRWSGPVTSTETYQLWLVGPIWNRLGYALSALTQLLLLLAVAACFYRKQWPQWRAKITGGGTAAATALLFGLFALPSETLAQNYPPQTLLQELKQRLTQPPQCLPTCASIESLELQADNDQLALTLFVHSAEDMSFPLPGHINNWMPQRVELNGMPAKWLHKHNARLYIRLSAGRHRIHLSGSTQGLEQIALDFDSPLRNVQTTLDTWQVNGLPDDKQASQTLQLQRVLQAEQQATQKLLPDPVLPLVRVVRNVQLGLDWQVSTTVQRVAPASGSIHLSIPLLDNEAPNSGTLTPDDAMRVSLSERQNAYSWTSTLKRSPQIELHATAAPQWTESWHVTATTHWHVQRDGIPPLADSDSAGSWTWLPWGNETVTLRVTKPEAIEGRHLSIDSLDLRQNVGKRASKTALEMQMRASQGGQYNFALPKHAQFKRLLIDGTETPVGHNENELQIPMAPGKHTIEIEWHDPVTIGLRTATPTLNMNLPVSNIRLHQHLPNDRWLLWVNGPTVGPAVLFWGMFIVVIIAALALGKTGFTPLKTRHWILLSLGTVAIDLYLLMIVAAWFIALAWRGRRQAAPDGQAFNLLQIALIGFSVIALGALLTSIPASLLSSPDMLLTGNGSTRTSLHWYQDISNAAIPQAYTISLPIWCYRLVMLMWAIWLAFALMRWIPWAWHQLCAGGFWFHQPKTQKEAKAPKEATSRKALPEKPDNDGDAK